MKVAFINPFIAAIHHVFDTMVHVPVKLGKPCLAHAHDTSLIVAAIVDLSGPVNGSVALRLSQRAALALASGLAGIEIKILDNDCLDAIGEIANIISGSAKKELSARCTNITVPQVSIGIPRRAVSSIPSITIPCFTKVGDFALEVRLCENKAP